MNYRIVKDKVIFDKDGVYFSVPVKEYSEFTLMVLDVLQSMLKKDDSSPDES